MLRDAELGSFAVPVQWTDRAMPSVCERLGGSPGRLDLDSLRDLVELLELLTSRAQKGFAK
jgi:hypothetical protein